MAFTNKASLQESDSFRGSVMYYAHIPAGYITSKLLLGRFSKYPLSHKLFIFFGILGAIAPDFDFLYYIFSPRGQGHHAYITHFPVFWATLLAFSYVCLKIDNKRHQWPSMSVVFTFSGFIHIVLDTLVGHIFWLDPFVDMKNPVSFAEYIPWDSGFLELFVFLLAIYLWKKDVIVKMLTDSDISEKETAKSSGVDK